MNARVQVAQAGSAPTSTPTPTQPPKVVKVIKPADGQAIQIELGYQQAAKLDLSAVANEKITLGFIGVGIMNRGHLGGFLGRKEVEVVAVCDVVKERLDHAKDMVEKRYADRIKSGENPSGTFCSVAYTYSPAMKICLSVLTIIDPANSASTPWMGRQ